jgi:predicted small metal-binding protein
MTCGQLGGTCSQKLSAYTWDDMVKAMKKHAMEKHPKDLARDMYRMRLEDPENWARAMKSKWDVAPEQGKAD